MAKINKKYCFVYVGTNKMGKQSIGNYFVSLSVELTEQVIASIEEQIASYYTFEKAVIINVLELEKVEV